MYSVKFSIFASVSILAFILLLTFQMVLKIQVPTINLILVIFLGTVIVGAVVKIFISRRHLSLFYKFFFCLLLFNSFTSSLLYWIRLREDYKYVTWNIDWRQTLAQSYAFSVSGTHNNLYQGFDSSYHSLPALLGSAMPAIFGGSPDLLLFLFIPLLCVFSLVNFIFVFIQKARLSSAVFVIASNIVLITPFYRFDNLTSLIKQYQDLFLLDSRLMLNTYLAIALVSSAAAITITTFDLRINSLIYGTTLFSLSSIKPQAIPFVAIFLMLTRYFAFKTEGISSKVASRYFLAHDFMILTLLSLLAMIFLRERTTLPVPVPTLALYFNNLYQTRTVLSVIAYFALIGMLTFLLFKAGVRLFAKTILLTSSIYASLFVVMILLEFRIDSDEASRWNLDEIGNPSVFDSDLEQGFIVIFILLLILVSVALTHLWNNSSYTLNRKRVLPMLVVIASLMKLIGSAHLYNEPRFGYEYVNSSKLVSALEDGDYVSLILVNDFSDPADNFQRYGRGEYMASEGPYDFFVASKAPDSFMASDFSTRISEVRKFFTTSISDYHKNFLEINNISHVLISSRCLPVWFRPESLDVKRGYVLITKSEFISGKSTFLDFSVMNSRKSQVKVFGLANCL